MNTIITDDINFKHSGFTQWVVHVHVAGMCMLIPHLHLHVLIYKDLHNLIRSQSSQVRIYLDIVFIQGKVAFLTEF